MGEGLEEGQVPLSPGGGVDVPCFFPRDAQGKRRKSSLEAHGSSQKQSCLERGRSLIFPTTKTQEAMAEFCVDMAG